MKKIILLCLVALATVTASAQFYVGGTLGASYDKTKYGDESVKQCLYMLSPEFGYNIDPSIAIGASMTFGYGDNDDDEQKLYEIAPYVRATFAKAKSVKFFAEGTLFLSHSKLSLFAQDISYNTYGAALRPGFMVNVGSNINIVGKATMLQYSRTDDSDVDMRRWTVGIPNSFTIGILVDF